MTPTALQVAKFDVLSAANVVLEAQNLLKLLGDPARGAHDASQTP